MSQRDISTLLGFAALALIIVYWNNIIASAPFQSIVSGFSKLFTIPTPLGAQNPSQITAPNNPTGYAQDYSGLGQGFSAGVTINDILDGNPALIVPIM